MGAASHRRRRPLTDVGGVAFDVDRDGWIDQVSGGVWYRNPGNPRSAPRWERFETGAIPTHDNVAADMDGDGRLDLVSLLDKSRRVLVSDPRRSDPAAGLSIKILGVTDPQCHGGLAVGDIDGDGDNDVARVDRWLENVDGKGLKLGSSIGTFDFGQSRPVGYADAGRAGRPGRRRRPRSRAGRGGYALTAGSRGLRTSHGNGTAWERRLIKKPGHKSGFPLALRRRLRQRRRLRPLLRGRPAQRGPERVWFLWENVDGKRPLLEAST
jgi:hypothetical protein